MGTQPLVSAVLVSWNSQSELLNCLRALLDHPPRGGIEPIVVDNGSVDGSVEAVRAEFPSVRVIANADNRGLPAANNQGIVATASPYVLIANPDTIADPGAIDALVATLERHPRAAFAIPRLRYDDGRLQTSAGNLPTFAGAYLGRQAQRARGSAFDSFWWDGWAHDEERAIGRGHESCYLVRREAIIDVGLQDESYVLDWEGIDWTARMVEAGWEVWFCPDAGVVHLGGASIRQAQTRWIVSSHRGMYRYFRKRTTRSAGPLLAAAIALRCAAKLGASKVKLAAYEQGHRRHGRRGKRSPS
jgi:GT2 family glycosyltransferase